MTLLQVCINAAHNAGVDAPTSIIGSADPAAQRLLQLARRTGIALAKKANWTALVVEHEFFANGTSDYALPTDFRSLVDDTMWDRTRYWRMRGAMSPQQWQMYKSSSLGQATVERRWRIRIPTGAADGAAPVFSLDPNIGNTDFSSRFVFEYVSKNWCASGTNYELAEAVPNALGTGYAVGDQITFNAAGITTVPPVALVTALTNSTTGSLQTLEIVIPGVMTGFPGAIVQSATTGGGSGATFFATATTIPPATQSDWAADTDTFLLDEDLLELGIIWRVLARLGLAYAEEREEYEREVDKAMARDGGTAVLNLTGVNSQIALLSPYNIQDGSWPG